MFGHEACSSWPFLFLSDGRAALFRDLLEQQRRELVKIVAPVNPRMPAGRFGKYGVKAVLLQKFDCSLRIAQQAVILPRAEPKDLETFLCAGVVEFRCVLLFPTGSARRGRRRSIGAGARYRSKG